jgi:hypothetical protein
MWYIITAVLVIGASGVFGYSRARTAGLLKAPSPGNIMTHMDFGKLSPEEINVLLSRLESEEPPDPAMGAMCYSPMQIPDSAEYICPICGEKTIYTGYETQFIEWTLPGMRRMAESIDSLTEFHVALDETQFCSFCSDTTYQDPQVILRVTLLDSSEIENPVSPTDLRMLDSFLRGRLYYLTDNDAQVPLQENADRLRELLGVPEEN